MPRGLHFLRISSLVLLLVVQFPAAVDAQESILSFSSSVSPDFVRSQADPSLRQLKSSFVLNVGRQAFLRIVSSKPQRLTVNFPPFIPLPASVALEAFEIFSPDAVTLAVDERGERPIDIQSGWLSFVGRIPSYERSLVVLNFTPSGVDALVEVSGARYAIRRVILQDDAEFIPHVFYATDEVASAIPFRCGVGEVGFEKQSGEHFHNFLNRSATRGASLQLKEYATPSRTTSPAMLMMGAGTSSSDTILVNLALEADYEVFLAEGDAVAATSLMVSMAAATSAIYVRDLGVKLLVGFTRVWETPSNPYPGTTVPERLNQFTSHWRTSMNHVQRSLAHLFTNSARWQDGLNIAGMAHLDVLCSTEKGYGVTDTRLRAADAHIITFAHEMGHNFGAHHTHSCQWPDGPLDYCAPVEGSCYDGPIVPQEGTIMSYCGSRRLEFHPVVRALMRRNAEFAWCAPSANPVAVAVADSSYLESLFSWTGGVGWERRTNWPDGPVTGRYGIAVRKGRVVAINLPANNLSGVLPLGLTNLTGLRMLNLSGRNHYHLQEMDQPDPGSDRQNMNRISGQIPPDIDRLVSLEFLDLSNNAFTGSIPNALGSLSNLQWINLSENEFTGTIPTSLGNLPQLRVLDLSRNRLSGSIPPSLGNLAQLRALVLAENYTVDGTIPPALGNLTKLISLRLNANALSGSLPDELGNLRTLTHLVVDDNALSGPLPASLGNLTALNVLSANRNQFSGTIPSTLSNLRRLSWLALNGNRFSGSIPTQLGSLTSLWRLDLAGNQLSGPIPSSLGRLTSLVELELQQNMLTGSLPDSLRFLGSTAFAGLEGLLSFRVGDNNLSGAIPEWLGERTSLSTLDLGGNSFSVTSVPPWVLNLKSLGRLHLHGLGLGGTIPLHLASLTNLFELKLSGNQLSGTIPPVLGNMTRLQLLWLSDNRLSGTIPTELGNLTLLSDLRLSGNNLRGTVPSSFSRLTWIVRMALHDNELESLPDFGGMPSLRQDPSSFVTLQNNRLRFEDIIPAAGIGILNFTYHPQKLIGTARSLSVSPGSDVRLLIRVDAEGSQYQWYHNGQPIAGATREVLQLVSVSTVDTGTYTVSVTNSSAPLLQLYREPYELKLSTRSYPEDLTLVHPADGATGISMPPLLVWNRDPLATRYHVQVDSAGTFIAVLFESQNVTTTSLTLPTLPAASRYAWRVRGANAEGVGNWSDVHFFTASGRPTDVSAAEQLVPSDFHLQPAYPNPFNAETRIGFSLPIKSRITIKVYNVLGQEVATLIDELQDAGIRSVRFDAAALPSGLYLCRMTAGPFRQSIRLLLAR